MNAIAMNNRSIAGNIVSTVFGITVFAVGLLNTFWGNDSMFGVFLIGLSFVYFPFSNALLKKITGITIPLVVKIVLALFIIWVVFGVGELFAKIDIMVKDLQ